METLKLVGVTAANGGLRVAWMDGVWMTQLLSVAVSAIES